MCLNLGLMCAVRVINDDQLSVITPCCNVLSSPIFTLSAATLAAKAMRKNILTSSETESILFFSNGIMFLAIR